MTVATGNVVRVDVLGDMDVTNQVVNSYQFRLGGVGSWPDDEVLTDLITLLRALYDAAKGLFTAIVVWRRIRVQNLTTGLLVGERDFVTPVTGTATGDQGAFQSAGLISFKSNIPRVVMRKYLPVSESMQTGDGRLIAGAQTLMNAFGDTLLSPMFGATGASYFFGYSSPKTAGFVEPLGRQISAVVATQRRRRPGVGS